VFFLVGFADPQPLFLQDGAIRDGFVFAMSFSFTFFNRVFLRSSGFQILQIIF